MNGGISMTALELVSLGKKLSNHYRSLCLPICRQYGINSTCFDILLFCADNPEHNTARDLCELRGLRSGIASVGVESLIQEGLLSRCVDTEDRRKKRLIPTEKAAPIIAAGRAMQAGFTQSLRKGISAEESAVFLKVICKLEENLSHRF